MDLKHFVLYILLLYSFFIGSQLQTIDHNTYNEWKSIKQYDVSPTGNYIVYTVNPYRGDGFGVINNLLTSKIDTVHRAHSFNFSNNGKVLSYKLAPEYDVIRGLELRKEKKEKWPKDTLIVHYLSHDSLLTIPHVINVFYPKKGGEFAFLQSYEFVKKQVPIQKNTFRWFKKKSIEEPINKEGGRLGVGLMNSSNFLYKDNVVEVCWSDEGDKLAYTTTKKVNKKDSVQIHLWFPQQDVHYSFNDQFIAVKNVVFSPKGNRLAFMATNDTLKKPLHYQLYLWDLNKNAPECIFSTTDTTTFLDNTLVSESSELIFSNDESRLFFGRKPRPMIPKKDTLLDREKAVLDVWNYRDKQLQPMQLLQTKKSPVENWLSVFHIDKGLFVPLANDTVEASLLDEGNAQLALGKVNKAYKRAYNWDYPWKSDYYSVDVLSGEIKSLAKEIAYPVGLSPKGYYFTYFDGESGHFYYKPTEADSFVCATCSVKDNAVNWTEDVNGMPHVPGAFGHAGYTKNDSLLILYSEFDIWGIELATNNISCLTNYLGQNSRTKLRIVNLQKDSTYIDLSETFVHGTDQVTKDETIYSWSFREDGKPNALEKRFDSPHRIFDFRKAKTGNRIVYRKMNVKDYPDLYTTDSSFLNETKISNINPQQDKFRWPTVQSIYWKGYNDEDLEGLLYLPEDFDSTKSYPLLVYFYELYSDRKHFHYVPKPTASIIFPTEYTSAEYLVFIPDIRYEPGYPAKSAYSCIMSGVDELLKQFPTIDSTRMGLQGQSWGGYQTAQLITMTDRFKAAMAGAPVSNMFSAYGGIRWGSGLNRQFQYERTQSRIGQTIWDAPELYVENSPLFGVPKIKTPLLIMHNDNDGAVPWYQGIELFTAMNRLDKPVWLLNYNGDKHNLMKDANRLDLSIRMRQFFDHFLKDKPAPIWLEHGVPAKEKGKESGLKLVTDE